MSLSYLQYIIGYGIDWGEFIQDIAEADTSSEPCTFWNYTNPPNNSTISIDSLDTINKVYKFNYTLSDNSGRSSTKNIFVLVISNTIVPVSIATPPVYQVARDKVIQLSASDPIISTSSGYS